MRFTHFPKSIINNCLSLWNQFKNSYGKGYGRKFFLFVSSVYLYQQTHKFKLALFLWSYCFDDEEMNKHRLFYDQITIFSSSSMWNIA